MRTHDGTVRHQTFQIGVFGTEGKEGLEDVLFTPTREAFVDAVPIAVSGRQEPPLCAAAGNPEDSGQELATFPLRPDIHIGTRPQKFYHFRPLGITDL